jgi:hypothetical protein
MTFINPSIIRLKTVTNATVEFNNNNHVAANMLTLSDHSRSPLSVSYDVLGSEQRMADGTMRKNVVAKKKTFSCTWGMLPTVRTFVADGNADARDMYEFWERYLYTPLHLDLYFMVNATERGVSPTSRDLALKNKESYLVFWTDLSFDIIKRFSNFDHWNVTADFVEV